MTTVYPIIECYDGCRDRMWFVITHVEFWCFVWFWVSLEIWRLSRGMSWEGWFFLWSWLLLCTFFSGVMEGGAERRTQGSEHVRCAQCGGKKGVSLKGCMVSQRMVDTGQYDSTKQWLCKNHWNRASEAAKSVRFLTSLVSIVRSIEWSIVSTALTSQILSSREESDDSDKENNHVHILSQLSRYSVRSYVVSVYIERCMFGGREYKRFGATLEQRRWRTGTLAFDACRSLNHHVWYVDSLLSLCNTRELAQHSSLRMYSVLVLSHRLIVRSFVWSHASKESWPPSVGRPKSTVHHPFHCSSVNSVPFYTASSKRSY